ncbi:MAG: geranylgeranylglycerol-phosphate geranylgeranyltransferase [Candidatus Bathyarchaeota archaeon]|nr:geranylgeranylglycerol-phosphate geranylgeranyltransferase [Candidatus Bathyarchaeota archaeon]
MGKAIGFIRLMRPVNCVMMGFAVFVGAVLANQQFTSAQWLNIIYGFFTGFTLTAASMTINDYYDRAIDAINEPSRPIPSGLVSTKEAIVFMVVLSSTGFVFAYLTSVLCLAVAVISWIILATYVTVGKRTGLPGNFLVSACVAIPFIYGSVAVTSQVQLNVVLFASMAFLSNTGREITKGIVDVKGDSAEGVKTLAVRYGERNAAVAAALFYVLAVSLTPLPWMRRLVSFWFIPFVLVTDIGLLASSALLLADHSRENAKKIKNLILLWFVIGLLAYIFGVLT